MHDGCYQYGTEYEAYFKWRCFFFKYIFAACISKLRVIHAERLIKNNPQRLI